ncbi:hypothetical protein C4K18_4260 [Pseudomonas chlororaphis subsp. aurantiaca]|nr:hypothetical protein C4K18_4260 [Pseudomonas chlororaphis subsp. aurantiaca]
MLIKVACPHFRFTSGVADHFFFAATPALAAKAFTQSATWAGFSP